jgi:uncharacterized LabA/DUF88 family protein
MHNLLIDAANMFRNVNKFFPNRKLNYAALLERVQTLSAEEAATGLKSIAYVSQSIKMAHRFLTALKALGFEVHFREPRTFKIGDHEIKRPVWNVEITVDAVKNYYLSRRAFETKGETLARFFIASTDTDFIPLYQWLKEQGVMVTVIGNGLPKSITSLVTDTMEITETLLVPVGTDDKMEGLKLMYGGTTAIGQPEEVTTGPGPL